MPANHPVPLPDAIREILADLLGRGVGVSAGAPLKLERDTPAIVAEYVTDTGGLAVAVLCDLRLANALGASLTMVPPAAVEEAVKRWVIDDENVENLREVANVLTQLFNCDDTPHLRFTDVHRLPGELPDATRTLLDRPPARRDLGVAVEDYGTGTLTVLCS